MAQEDAYTNYAPRGTFLASASQIVPSGRGYCNRSSGRVSPLAGAGTGLLFLHLRRPPLRCEVLQPNTYDPYRSDRPTESAAVPASWPAPPDPTGRVIGVDPRQPPDGPRSRRLSSTASAASKIRLSTARRCATPLKRGAYRSTRLPGPDR